jgi:hemolysin III
VDQASGIAATVPRLRGLLHLISAPASFLAGLILIWSADTTAARIACAVFVLTALNLFGISATYHRGAWSVKTKLALRRYDHSNIFLIIAGTYTPIAVVLLNADQSKMLLFIIWACAIGGVLLSVFWPHAPRWVSVPVYLGMGWISVFFIPALLETGGWLVVGLIALGGLLYSAGAVVYGIKKPNINVEWFGFHELFHAFTVAAFVAHFASIVIAVNYI